MERHLDFPFFFNKTPTTEIYTLSLHDALPISPEVVPSYTDLVLKLAVVAPLGLQQRSEEHTSELQSQSNLVCRLLLEKKKNTICLIYGKEGGDVSAR